MLLAPLLLDCELPWANILNIKELLLLLRLDWVHRRASVGSLLLEALFDVLTRMPGEVAVVQTILGLLFEGHVRLDVVHLRREVGTGVTVVLTELFELEFLESLVDVLLFDLLAINLEYLIKVHNTHVVLALGHPSHSIIVGLDIVDSFDLSSIKILFKSYFLCKVS